MPRLLVSNNEDARFPTNNNKDGQKIPAKQLSSYYGATKAPNVSDLLILGPSTLDVCSRKSKRTTRNKDSLILTTNIATKKQNKSDLLIPFVSTEIVSSYKSESTNTKNINNKRDGTPTCICAIGCRHLQKNRKIITKNDSDKSKKDKMSNVTDKRTEEKELGTSNSSIKVHIS